jgi:hypothetical protein
LCFLAYWLNARLGGEWRAKGVSEAVPRVLRHLETGRLGRLQMGPHVHRTRMPPIPKSLNDPLRRLGLAALFAAPPKLQPDEIEKTSGLPGFPLDRKGSQASWRIALPGVP